MKPLAFSINQIAVERGRIVRAPRGIHLEYHLSLDHSSISYVESINNECYSLQLHIVDCRSHEPEIQYR
jgi:hypothetical protein